MDGDRNKEQTILYFPYCVLLIRILTHIFINCYLHEAQYLLRSWLWLRYSKTSPPLMEPEASLPPRLCPSDLWSRALLPMFRGNIVPPSSVANCLWH